MSKISFAIKNPSFAAEGKSAKAVRTPGCPKAGGPCPGQRKIKKRLAIAGFTTSKRRHQQARFPRGNVHNAECQSFFLISSQSPSFLLDEFIIQDEGEVVKGKNCRMSGGRVEEASGFDFYDGPLEPQFFLLKYSWVSFKSWKLHLKVP